MGLPATNDQCNKPLCHLSRQSIIAQEFRRAETGVGTFLGKHRLLAVDAEGNKGNARISNRDSQPLNSSLSIV
jgi:hypothetical protein